MTAAPSDLPYIPRHLVSWDKNGVQHRVTEQELATLAFPIVILGEPGMGKTRLLEKIGKRTGWPFVRAAALVRNPERWRSDNGHALIIDALDEIAALEERDPLHNVLAALGRIGSPPFILSCRAADWRQASARRDISEDYGRSASEWTIAAITEREAGEALCANGRDRERVDALLATVRERSLGDLIGNPLNLRLLAAFVDRPDDLPRSKADLFRRATNMLRLEHGTGYGNGPLAKLSEEQSLDAAGALMATWLITGSEAIGVTRLSEDGEADLLAFELADLVPTERLAAVLTSRLFRSADESARRLPLHRTLAEFLGARWLAGKVRGKRQAQARLLAQITADAMVPASLRGLHAWLAHFDDTLLDAILETDPYGLLRYGDTDALTADQARRGLAALRRLDENDPNFRAGDWSEITAPALAQIELVPDLREILNDPTTGFQLRSLLLETIKDSPSAPLLAQDLATITLNGKLTYRERADAGEALVALTSEKTRWRAVIEQLGDMTDDASWRLAAAMVADAGIEFFSDDEVARVALRATGFPEAKGRRAQSSFSGLLYRLETAVPDDRIEALLDTLADAMEIWASSAAQSRPHWENSHELIRFARRLMVRYFEHWTPAPVQLWRWLDLFERDEFYRDKRSELIASRLSEKDDLRRGIQRHVLFLPGPPAGRRHRVYELQRLSSGLAFRHDDLLVFLDEIAAKGVHDEISREAWRMLVNQSRTTTGVPDDIRQVAARFSKDDEELQDFIDPKPDPTLREWEKEERKWERQRRREKAKREKFWAEHRDDYARHLDEVRQGDVDFLGMAAKVYFGLYRDIDSQLEPVDRLASWIGPDLPAELLNGFQALLRRDDLPSPKTLADSYASGQYWHVIHPILAALNELARADLPFDDLSTDTLLRGRIGIWGEILDSTLKDDILSQRIDDALDARDGGMEQALRLWMEPHLAAGGQHIIGLYEFARGEEQRPLARRLAIEWLQRFPDLPVEIERELVDAALGYQRRDEEADARQLTEIAAARIASVGPDNPRHDLWLATLFLADFQVFLEIVAKRPASADFLWSARWISGFQRHKRISHYSLAVEQLVWLIATFRTIWPEAHRTPGVSSGDRNKWDATEIIDWAIGEISRDTSDTGVAALTALRDAETDSYTERLRMAVAAQRRARMEAAFSPPDAQALIAAIDNRPPSSAAEVQAIIVDELGALQDRIRGDAENTVDLFYTGDRPKTENQCRNALLALLGPQLPFGIHSEIESAMPSGKRADATFRLGGFRVPLEAKGQWEKTVWDAPDRQLSRLYMRDHLAQDRGIFVVFWFGRDAPAGKRLRRPPDNLPMPAGAIDMKAMLETRIPPGLRDGISIFVLDLTRADHGS